MTRRAFTREFYIPAKSVKVADKLSDAVAYLSINRMGKPRATVFVGKQAKPLSDYYYSSEAQREKAVRAAFENNRAHSASRAARRAERTSWVPTYKVGDIFRTCWGYDQTNVEYFEIVEATGKFAILREIAQDREETGWLQGKCAPVPGKFVGEPIRRMMQQRGIKIDDVRTGWKIEPTVVAGVKVYNSASWSAYA